MTPAFTAEQAQAAGRLQAALRNTFDALPDDKARMRWGRALEYFIGRLEGDDADDPAGVARDVLVDFVNASGGLRKAAVRQHPELADVTWQLDQACRHTLSDVPLRPFSIGVQRDNQSPAGEAVADFLRLVRDREQKSGADFTLNAVFFAPGRFVHPSWQGARSSSLSIDLRIAMVQVAIPESVDAEATWRFGVDALANSIPVADAMIRRRKLTWSTDVHRDFVASLSSSV